MKEAIEETDFNNDKSHVTSNDLYSPSCFKCLKDLMHLFPLWSRAMYRLAVSNSSCEKSPSSMTNAKVESYFRTLKKGTLRGRTKLRPREILCEELKRVRGVLKANKLPETINTGLKRKKLSSFLHEEEEKWREKRRRKKYSDADFSRRVLNPRNLNTDVPYLGKTAENIEDNEFEPLQCSPGTNLE